MLRTFARRLRNLAAPLSTWLLLLLLAAPARASVSPHVLAFYYAWFDANTWQPSVVPDMPAQPYASNDPAAIARQVRQAKDAGIDAFVMSWIGANLPPDGNFKLLLNAAQGAGIAATIDFEAQRFGSAEAVQGALAYVRDSYMGHPAFLREGGKPVLFFWREQVLPVSAWAAIRQAIDPNHNQIWIAEGVDISYQQVFDGHHLYSIAWSPDVSATLADWSSRVRRAGTDKVWVATVMPGYDDTRTTRSDKFARARNNGDFYRATWQAAMNSAADWVVITSFNEWVEGSMIEPSTSYGNLYLDLTREYARQFKAETRPSPAPAPTAAQPASPAGSAKAAIAAPPEAANTVTTTDTIRARTGPGKEYPTLGRIVEGSKIQVVGRSEDSTWLQVNLPRELTVALNIHGPATGWVAAEYVTPQDGFRKLPVVAAPPATPVPTREAQPSPTPAPSAEAGEPSDDPPSMPPFERMEITEE